VFLEKLTVTQLLKKFLAFSRIWRFITMFTKACHWSLFLSKINSVHTLPPYFPKMHSNIILSTTRSSKWSYVFPSGFLTKTLYVFLISHMNALIFTLWKSLIPRNLWSWWGQVIYGTLSMSKSYMWPVVTGEVSIWCGKNIWCCLISLHLWILPLASAHLIFACCT